MPLDPQTEALIASVAGGKPVEQMTVQEMRDALEQRVSITGGTPEAVAQVLNSEIPGPGGPIAVRIYVPDGADSPKPALVFFHGGGWVRGSLNTHDLACRSLANGAGCIVVSVDYRMAPEHLFPAAVDDCLAATRWVVDNASQLGVDPKRVAVGGDSAGGNLAAVVAQQLRETVIFQLLIYPVTDRSFETQSYRDNADGYMLTREAMRYYWRTYQPDDSLADDPRASPLRAADLSGLAPALVITAEYDPLRDEGRAYAERLKAAGVPTAYSEYAGTVHGFVTSAGVLDLGKQAVRESAAALREAFTSAMVTR
jgi:acetyl esterase